MPRAHGSRLTLAALVLIAGVVTGAAATAATDTTGQRVVLVVDRGGCGGDAETLKLCDGFRSAMRRTGVTGRVVSPTYRENAGDFIDLLARQRYETIMIFGLYFDPSVAAVIKRHRETRFAVIDASWKYIPGRPENVQGVVFRTSEAAFLAGWLAGKLEQRRRGRDVVGVVGGLPVPVVRDFAVGFAAGARRAAPGITVLKAYSYDWVDPSKCAALARRQIARGAGTVFNVAGGCGLGTLEAARAAGVWGVGVDSDQSFLGPHILTSVLKHFDAAIVAVMRQVQAGRILTRRDTILTMRDGAVGLGRVGPGVPRTLLAQVEALRRQVVAGKIGVPAADS